MPDFKLLATFRSLFEGKPYFLLGGRKAGRNKKPSAARASDKVYRWTWKNLRVLIHGGR